MKPIIEDTKIDKIVQENFESIRNVLGGNVSLDNMSLRVLEGTTKGSDTKNLVNHSSARRPVGWLPLVGDVYVQGIDNKYMDIRSTKPSVNYKILIIFGPPITSESLKAEGGDGYANTNTTVENITQEIVIEQIEDIQVTFKPTVVKNFTNQALWGLNNYKADQFNSVVTDGDYFYITATGGFLATNQRMIYRVNRTTGTTDYLNLGANIDAGLSALTIAADGFLYAITYQYGAANRIFVTKVDLTTFTLDHLYTIVLTVKNISSLLVDDTNIYFTHTNSATKKTYISRVNKTTEALTTLSLDATDSYCYPGEILKIGGSLYCLYTNLGNVSASIAKVQINTFTLANTFTTTYAYLAKTMVQVGNNLYIPVVSNQTLANNGGTPQYDSAIAVFDLLLETVSIVPIGGALATFWNNIVTSDDYLYISSIVTSTNYGNTGTVIIRYDTLLDTYITGWIPLFSENEGGNSLNATVLIDTDDNSTPLFIRDHTGNFEYSTVDFTDYD